MAASITPVITLSRPSSGIAPCVVQAHAWNSTALQNDGVTAVPSPGHSLAYEWDFGDPSSQEVVVNPLTGISSPTNRQQGVHACHTYTRPGTYTIRLTARYYDPVSGVWLSAQTTSSAVVVGEATLYDTAYFDSAATVNGDGSQESPYNTLAALRAFLDRRSSVVAYVASGSVFAETADADVLALRGVSKVRVLKYTPVGSTDASNPVLRLANSASGKAVVRLTAGNIADQNTVQTLTVGGSGQFRLTFRGEVGGAIVSQTTGNINTAGLAASTIATALEGLAGIGSEQVAVTGTGPYTITFQGTLAAKDVRRLVVTPGTSGYTGGTITNVVTTYGRPSSRPKNDDVVFEGIDFDGNGSATSVGVDLDVDTSPAGDARHSEFVYLRRCRTTRTMSHGMRVQLAKSALGSGTDGPTAIGAIRSVFDLNPSGSAGHTVNAGVMAFLCFVGCSFSGGAAGNPAADHHVTTAELTGTNIDFVLVRACGFGDASTKFAAVNLLGGVRKALIHSTNFTKSQTGLVVDRTSTFSMPEDVIVEGCSFNNMGVPLRTTARGVRLGVAANVSIRNNTFYENGFSGAALANGEDVFIDDSAGTDGTADQPIRIVHNSFYRSVSKCAAPIIRINDRRHIAVENNAIRYDGSFTSGGGLVIFSETVANVRTDAIAGKIVFKGNTYYAPYFVDSTVVAIDQLYTVGNTMFGFSGGSVRRQFAMPVGSPTNPSWQNLLTSPGADSTTYFDVPTGSPASSTNPGAGRILEPEWQNPGSGNFRYTVVDNLVGTAFSSSLGVGNHKGLYYDYLGSLRAGGIVDCGAFQSGATFTGSSTFLYDRAAIPNLPTAGARNWREGDVRYIELTEPAVAIPTDPTSDVTNRPSQHLAHRDNLLASSISGLLLDVNDAFCAPPQPGSFLAGPHKSIQSFISVGHNPDGTVKLDPAALASLGFLRVDGANEMLADLPLGGFRGVNAAPGVAGSDLATVGQVILTTGGTLTGNLLVSGTSEVQLTGTGRVAFTGAPGAGQIDMNGGRIRNLPVATQPDEPVRLSQLSATSATAILFTFNSYSATGNHTITVNGNTTGSLPNASSLATIRDAITSLASVGATNADVVTCSGTQNGTLGAGTLRTIVLSGSAAVTGNFGQPLNTNDFNGWSNVLLGGAAAGASSGTRANGYGFCSPGQPFTFVKGGFQPNATYSLQACLRVQPARDSRAAVALTINGLTSRSVAMAVDNIDFGTNTQTAVFAGQVTAASDGTMTFSVVVSDVWGGSARTVAFDMMSVLAIKV